MPLVSSASHAEAPGKMLDTVCEQLAKTGLCSEHICLTSYYTESDYRLMTGARAPAWNDWRSIQKRIQAEMLRHRYTLVMAHLDATEFGLWREANGQCEVSAPAIANYIAWMGSSRGQADFYELQPPPLPPFLVGQPTPKHPDLWWGLRLRSPVMLVQFIFVHHDGQVQVHATPFRSPKAPVCQTGMQQMIETLTPQVVDYLRLTRQAGMTEDTGNVECTIDESANPVVPEHVWLENNLVRPYVHGIFSVADPIHLAFPRLDGKVGIANILWLEAEPPDPALAVDTIASATAFHEMRVTGDTR